MYLTADLLLSFNFYFLILKNSFTNIIEATEYLSSFTFKDSVSESMK